MYKSVKKAFIPAATLACIGVEHAPGALPCQSGISENQECNPYNVNFIKTEAQTTSKHEVTDKKLYNRDSIKEVKTTKNVIAKKDRHNIDTKSTKNQETTTQKPQETILNQKKPKQETKKIASEKSKNSKIITKAKDIEIPTITTKVGIKKDSTKQLKAKVSNKYTYIVSKGDTLDTIAEKFNLSLSALLKLNNLQDAKVIKLGQKIILPKNIKKRIIATTYTVVNGDTLEAISKKTGVSKAKLIKYNNIDANKIKAGQKLFLTYNKQIKKILKNKKTAIKAKRQIRVTATAYTSHASQTDKTPFLAAWNNRIRPGMKIIAVSRDLIKRYGLTNGVKVRIKGLPGLYTIRDKMNKRFRSRIDIYMGTNRHKALRWGKKRIVLMW